MENEMIQEVSEVIEVDTEKAIEIGAEIAMSDYTRGFLHGGIALGAGIGAKRLWDNREVVKLKTKALFGKAEIIEKIEE